MPVEKSHARLGAFLVVVLLLAIATGLLFVQRARTRAVLDLVTYTTENISGLDVSSPVRLRGVPVGRVTELRVDPLGKTVEIDFEMFLDRLNTIGMDVQRIRQTADVTRMFPNLRAQVIGSLVTGEAYLLIDAPERPPASIELGFTPTRAYIPSMPSPRAAVTDRLPEVLERTEATLQVLREIISRIPDSLDRSDRFFTNVERIIRDSDLPGLSTGSRSFFTTTTAQIGQMTSDLQSVIGPEGKLVTFLDDVRRAVEAADLSATNQAARAAADRTVLAADDLRRVLPSIRDSLGQLSDLARQLQEQPESVVYGPRPAVKP
jgi:phospholipid/cholesterol/gamma-HCH transport system substrate-binding protein